MGNNERIQMDSILKDGKKISRDAHVNDPFRLPVRVVETPYDSEYAIEAQIRYDKIAEQERLEQTHKRPTRLPIVEFGSSETRYFETEDVDSEAAASPEFDEWLERSAA